MLDRKTLPREVGHQNTLYDVPTHTEFFCISRASPRGSTSPAQESSALSLWRWRRLLSKVYLSP